MNILHSEMGLLKVINVFLDGQVELMNLVKIYMKKLIIYQMKLAL